MKKKIQSRAIIALQSNLKGKLDQITQQLISEIKIRDAKQDEMIFNTYRKGLILLALEAPS